MGNVWIEIFDFGLQTFMADLRTVCDIVGILCLCVQPNADVLEQIHLLFSLYR